MVGIIYFTSIPKPFNCTILGSFLINFKDLLTRSTKYLLCKLLSQDTSEHSKIIVLSKFILKSVKKWYGSLKNERSSVSIKKKHYF